MVLWVWFKEVPDMTVPCDVAGEAHQSTARESGRTQTTLHILYVPPRTHEHLHVCTDCMHMCTVCTYVHTHAYTHMYILNTYKHRREQRCRGKRAHTTASVLCFLLGTPTFSHSMHGVHQYPCTYVPTQYIHYTHVPRTS